MQTAGAGGPMSEFPVAKLTLTDYLTTESRVDQKPDDYNTHALQSERGSPRPPPSITRQITKYTNGILIDVSFTTVCRSTSV
jgi:hypothetical protein